eukprot:7439606-Lingulodinium_polyedra.AAC.1
MVRFGTPRAPFSVAKRPSEHSASLAGAGGRAVFTVRVLDICRAKQAYVSIETHRFLGVGRVVLSRHGFGGAVII